MNIPAGLTAFVTGASGNLGTEVVHRLSGAGVATVAAYRTKPDSGLEKFVTRQVQCDVADEASVAHAFQEFAKGPQIIVHCAGGFASDGTVEKTSVKTWNSMLSLNLLSSFLIVREGMRSLGPDDYGRIVLVSAYAAFDPGKGAIAYKVSKGGLQTLVEVAHAERPGTGVTINALAPRVIDTPQNRSDMPDADHSSWVTPQALADAVLFLCSESGGSISGSILPFP